MVLELCGPDWLLRASGETRIRCLESGRLEQPPPVAGCASAIHYDRPREILPGNDSRGLAAVEA